MLQFFDTLSDLSGNALGGTGAIVVTAYPGGGATPIYSSNGTANPITGSTVFADVTGQVSFYLPDGAYIFTYQNNGTTYKTRVPVQVLDPMGFVESIDSGAANAYAVTSSAYPASLYVGLKLEIKAANSNTGATTLNLNGTGAQAVVQPGGSALGAGQILAGGLFRLEWDGTNWQLIGTQSPPYFAIAAGENPANIVSYAYPWDHPARYGASTAANDNATALNNMLAANILVDGRGVQYSVGSTITQNTAAPVRNLSLLANQSFPTTATGNYATQSVFYAGPNANGDLLDNIIVDGGLNAGTGLSIAPYGITCQAGKGRMRSIVVQHCTVLGAAFISTASGDSGCVGYQIQQYNNSDAQFAAGYATWTMTGLYHNRPDCFSIAGEGSFIRWCKIPQQYGPNASTVWTTRGHAYPSTYKGNTFGAPASIDAVGILVQEGASSINIGDGYHDSYHIDLHSTDVHLIGGQPLQAVGDVTGGSQFLDPHFIRVYASGKGTPYDLDIDMPTAYLGASNSPGGSSAATSFIGFNPETTLLPLLSITGNGATGSLTYAATSLFPPQANSAFYLASVSPSGFNQGVAATATVLNTLYQILTIGSTDFTAIGADSNTVGQCFEANGAGSGSGTCAQVYIVTSATQVGGIGSTVTVNFATSVNATGSGGTFQRAWAQPMLGLDSAQGLLPNGAHQRIRGNAGAVQLHFGNNSTPANTVWSCQPFFQEQKQAQNQFPNIWQYGNQVRTYPYAQLTTGFLAVVAANAAGGPYPAARIGLNLTGSGVGDTGSTNGALTRRTQSVDRITLDGLATGSGGAQAEYPNTTNYLSSGMAGHLWTAIFATNTTIQTSDERLKTDVEVEPLGLNFIEKLKPVQYRWKVGGITKTGGQWVFPDGSPAPADWDPQKNHDAFHALGRKLRTYPGARRAVLHKGGEVTIEGRTPEQDIEYGKDLAEHLRLARLGQNISRSPEVDHEVPGKRLHHGMIAQNVKATLDELGVADFAGWNLMDKNNADSDQALGYGEFIAPMIKAIQELSAQVKDLQAKLGAK